MIASEVPAPEVDCSVSVEAAPVPPLMSGTVSEVQVGVEVVLIVTPPVAADTLMFVPAVRLVTPVLVTVTPPVDADTLMPVLAVRLVTPVLLIVIEPEPLVIPMAVPAVSVPKA